MKKLGLILLMVIGLGILWAAPALAALENRVADTVTLKADETTEGDLLCQGIKAVTINGTVSGNLFVSAPTITINGTVKGSVFVLTTGTYRQSGTVGGNLWLFGADIAQTVLDGKVNGIITIWNTGKLELGKNAAGGGLFSKSTRLIMDGTIDGRMESQAATITIDGTVAGDCLATNPRKTGTIRVGSHARLGSFNYYSPKEPTVETGAVTGKHGVLPAPPDPNQMTPNQILLNWIRFLGTLVLGFILIRFFPARVIHWGTTVVPFLSTSLIGLLILIGVPVAALFLSATAIGIPIAIFIMALYLAMLVICQLPAYLYIGSGLIRFFRVERRFPVIFLMFLGGIVIFLLSTLPQPYGLVFNALATVLGVGLLVRRPRGIAVTMPGNGPER